MSTKRCPFCAEQIQADAIKCRFCGSGVQPGTCIKCGKQNRPEAKFCGYCGGGELIQDLVRIEMERKAEEARVKAAGKAEQEKIQNERRAAEAKNKAEREAAEAKARAVREADKVKASEERRQAAIRESSLAAKKLRLAAAILALLGALSWGGYKVWFAAGAKARAESETAGAVPGAESPPRFEDTQPINESAAAPAPGAEPPRPEPQSRLKLRPEDASLPLIPHPSSLSPQPVPAQPEPAQPAEDERFPALRERMVAETIEARGVTDASVLRAMRKVRRHTFVPASQVARAYEDNALPIEEGKTISQPYIVAFMTEAVRLKPGDKVLELGTGSGYQAAVAAEVGADVYSMELIDNLAVLARKRLDANGYSRVKVKSVDGYYGWEEHAPFDAIIITCAANHVPPSLLKQLRDGGRLIMPLGAMRDSQSLTLITKNGKDIRTDQVMDVIFSQMGGAVESR